MINKQQSKTRSSIVTTVLAAMFCVMGTSAWASPGMGEHPGMGMQGHGGMAMGKSSGHGQHGMRPHNAAVHFLKMADALDITDDQRAKLIKLRDDYIAKNATTEAQLKAGYSDLPGLLHANDIDMKAADALLNKVGKLEAQLWHAFAQQLHDIKALLTTEQKSALNDMHRMPHPGMGGRDDDMPMHGKMR